MFKFENIKLFSRARNCIMLQIGLMFIFLMSHSKKSGGLRKIRWTLGAYPSKQKNQMKGVNNKAFLIDFERVV